MSLVSSVRKGEKLPVDYKGLTQAFVHVKDEVHCVKSGYRQELSCESKDLHMKAEPGKLVVKRREMKFKSCTPRDTTTLTLVRVFLFEVFIVSHDFCLHSTMNARC